MRFVMGQDRSQSTLFPALLDDYIGDDNPVQAIDVFVDELRLGDLGFDGVRPHASGRPAYHPATRFHTWGNRRGIVSVRGVYRTSVWLCSSNPGEQSWSNMLHWTSRFRRSPFVF